MLTARQAKFIDEYLVDRNGAGAAVRAGYSAACARETAYRLLTNDHIAKIVEQRTADEARRLGVTRERILKELYDAAMVAMESGDVRDAVVTWREIATLLGYYPSKRRVKRSLQPGNDIETMDDSELFRLAGGLDLDR